MMMMMMMMMMTMVQSATNASKLPFHEDEDHANG
jgi:hypothetical protein